MTKVLLLAVAAVFGASAAQACEFQRSAQGKDVDQTTVASVAVEQSQPETAEVPVQQVPAQVVAE